MANAADKIAAKVVELDTLARGDIRMAQSYIAFNYSLPGARQWTSEQVREFLHREISHLEALR